MGEPQKVLTVLETDAQFEGTKIAIASRTGEIEAAKECMRLIEVDIKGEMSTLDQIASFVEVYPTCKAAHFNQFLQHSGVAYKDMLFFDDEYRNVQDVSRLGVTCQFCPDGVTWSSWVEGIQAYQNEKQK
ncbi:hypothetical protein PInf_017212 [Phytophthora infestans]|nr:hypothetical protein PInf_017212 [Phytophthora infestans]